jgi:catechol 2,3-dioxygenase-like lactoylglutathione lyase family enzyme
MGQKIGLVALIVPEYQAGLDFFVGALGFKIVEDRVDGAKRWIVVRPPGAETGLVIARAVGSEQIAAIGNQSGGRVGFFLQTDDFDRDASQIVTAGGLFEEKPRDEVYGRVAVFRDPFGNRWDLIQPAT